MTVHLVTYDLNNKKDYPKLFEAIKSAGSDWCHPLDSTWFVVSTASDSQIRDHIRKSLDNDDSLIVATLSNSAAWVGISEVYSTWLKKNLA